MTEFITRNYGNENYEIIIKTDRNDHYRETEDFARRLIDHAKHMTNADCIRSMTDEELAELLANETYRIAEHCFDAFGYGLEKQVIYAKRLEWLQQPVEKPKEDA